MTASLLITALDVNANEHCPLLDVLYTVLCPSLSPLSLFSLLSLLWGFATCSAIQTFIVYFFVLCSSIVARMSPFVLAHIGHLVSPGLHAQALDSDYRPSPSLRIPLMLVYVHWLYRCRTRLLLLSLRVLIFLYKLYSRP